jgi:hypothetical protein
MRLSTIPSPAPTPDQLAILRRANPRGFLEAWDIIGEPPPSLFELEHHERWAAESANQRRCVDEAWLTRRYASIREPSVWWELTELGRWWIQRLS